MLLLLLAGPQAGSPGRKVPGGPCPRLRGPGLASHTLPARAEEHLSQTCGWQRRGHPSGALTLEPWPQRPACRRVCLRGPVLREQPGHCLSSHDSGTRMLPGGCEAAAGSADARVGWVCAPCFKKGFLGDEMWCRDQHKTLCERQKLPVSRATACLRPDPERPPPAPPDPGPVAAPPPGSPFQEEPLGAGSPAPPRPPVARAACTARTLGTQRMCLQRQFIFQIGRVCEVH